MFSFWSKAGLAVLLTVVLLSLGCNDVYRPIVTPIPLPGGDPSGADYVAVLNQNPSGDRDVVSFLDVSGDTNIGNRQVGPGAAWMTWTAGKSAVIVPNSTLDTSTQTSYATSVVGTASLLSGSDPVYAYSRSGSYMYILNRGTNSDCPSSGSIGVLLTSSNSLQTDICVGPHPTFFTQTPDGQRLIVLDDTLNQAWIINVVSNTIEAKLPVGTSPAWAVVSPNSSTAYVVNKGSGDMTVLDIANDAVRNASIATNGSSPVYIAMDTKRTRVYVSNQGSDSVSVFDISGVTPVQLTAPVSVGSGASPYSIAVLADGSAVFVADTATNVVTRIDGNSFLPTQIPISQVAGSKVTWVAASIAGARVYATFTEPTDMNNGTAIIRTSDNALVATIDAPRQDVPSCDPTVATCNPARMRPVLVMGRQ
ncbi:MAG: YncE family protein [Terriglobia bacterium]|jgi:DNA-binding beta-propeller fold protein YncE|nr:YncE family protein [Terriglobia bacterium]